jgi:two-component system cell cycle sensor histidine kinase/response regulator CckA
MRSLRDMSVRRKLTAITTASAGVALLLACAAFVVYELVTFRESMVRNLSAEAQIVGRQSTSAIVFKDPDSATGTLDALRAEPNVVSAAIYTFDGTLFASYVRDGTSPPAPLPRPPASKAAGHAFESQRLVLFRPIEFDDAYVGTVVIESDLREMTTRLQGYAAIVSGVLIVSLLVAHWTASRFQRLITGPVLHLAQTAQRVSSDRDYSVRAVAHGRDELGLLVSTFNDMLDQIQQRDAALRTAQERLAHVVSSSPAVLYSLRVEEQRLAPTWVSANIVGVIGYTSEEVGGGEWWAERVHPEDLESALAQHKTLLSEGYAAREFRFRHKDGSYRWVGDEQRLVRDAAGKPVEVVGSWSDVTPRKQAELRLLESEEQYRLLFDSNPQPMWVYDERTLAFLAVNDAAIRHYGYSRDELLAMTIRDIRPSEEVPLLDEQVARRLREGDPKSFHSPRVWKHRKKDGSLIDVEIAVGQIAFSGRKARLALVSDVTERRRLEAQLLQAQKMDSVGRLAGGVAHDFNNLLGVITGYGELLRKRITNDRQLKKYVDDILKAAERAAGLTRQLLAFSRKQVLQPRVLDLNTVVGEMDKMLRRLIGEDIQLVTVLGDPLGRVQADPGQMEQVLMNLAVNARDAMPRVGRLTVETANVDLDAAYARTRPGVKPGPHVMLAVSDTGHGMDLEVQSHIFEPFFTTKDPGKGTGLGLATVHGIVRQSGGHIFVYSELEHGTTFKVYLPRLEEGETVVEATPAQEAGLQRGSETVLLVEDEESLRNMVREILEDSGYTVIEAHDAGHALEIAERHPAPIDLLMTDVVMPGMSGRDLAARLAASHSETRVLYMSGYTDDAVVLHGVLAADVAFLQKPFTPEALARKVREVLAR